MVVMFGQMNLIVIGLIFFKVQSEVSQTIAKEIAVKITPETKIIIETDPTSNITAYDYYLRGKDYYRNTRLSDRRKPATNAIKMYEKAVEIDSNFVLAWVGLAECNRRFYWYSQRYQKGTREDHVTKTIQHLAKTKGYLDRAIKLKPDLMEVRCEEGKYYYHCLREHSTALQIFEKLSADYPQDDETVAFIGYLLGNIGEVEKSLEFLKKAISLNLSYWNTWEQAGLTLRYLRKNDEAEIYFIKGKCSKPIIKWFFSISV